MANNRLWLGSIPANMCIFLGKTMDTGYYKAPTAEALNTFYDLVFDNCNNKEDFFIFTEESSSFTAGKKIHNEFNIRDIYIENGLDDTY